eukprot:gene17099-biopygen12339
MFFTTFKCPIPDRGPRVRFDRGLLFFDLVPDASGSPCSIDEQFRPADVGWELTTDDGAADSAARHPPPPPRCVSHPPERMAAAPLCLLYILGGRQPGRIIGRMGSRGEGWESEEVAESCPPPDPIPPCPLLSSRMGHLVSLNDNDGDNDDNDDDNDDEHAADDDDDDDDDKDDHHHHHHHHQQHAHNEDVRRRDARRARRAARRAPLLHPPTKGGGAPTQPAERGGQSSHPLSPQPTGRLQKEDYRDAHRAAAPPLPARNGHPLHVHSARQLRRELAESTPLPRLSLCKFPTQFPEFIKTSHDLGVEFRAPRSLAGMQSNVRPKRRAAAQRGWRMPRGAVCCSVVSRELPPDVRRAELLVDGAGAAARVRDEVEEQQAAVEADPRAAVRDWTFK